MKKHFLAGLALMGALVTAPASATVSVGDKVTCGGVSFECSNDNATVGNGAEFGIDFDTLGTLLTADFSAGLLTINFTNNPGQPDGSLFGSPFALVFTNLTDPFTFAALGDITNVYGFDGTDLTAFDPANISVDGGALTVNLSNAFFAPDSSLQVKFDRGTTPPTPGAVPEPATWAMMLLGFGLVGAAVRRRKAATVQPLLA